MIKHNPLLLISLAVLLLVSSPSQAAIEFDGVDDYISTAFNPLNNLTTGNTTSVCVQIAFNNSSARKFIYGLSGVPRWYLFLEATTGQVYFGIGSQGLGTNTYLAPGAYALCIVKNGTSVNVYKDGVLDSSNVYAGDNVLPNVSTPIGVQDTVSSPWQGQLDDLRIYNRALTASEVEILYNAKRKRVGGSVANGMVAHYEMDGGEIGSAVSTVIDASGNSNHGTGNGGASLKFIDGVVQR